MNKLKEKNSSSDIVLNLDFCKSVIECTKHCQEALIQVLYFEEIPRKEKGKPLRYNVALSDGFCYFRAAFCHEASRKIHDNHLAKYDIILVTKYLVSLLTSQGTTLVMITDFERKISGVKRIIGKPVYISDYRVARCKNPFGSNRIAYDELFQEPKASDLTNELYSQFMKETPLEITTTPARVEATPPKRINSQQSDENSTKKKVMTTHLPRHRSLNYEEENKKAFESLKPEKALDVTFAKEQSVSSQESKNKNNNNGYIGVSSFTRKSNSRENSQKESEMNKENQQNDAVSSSSREYKAIKGLSENNSNNVATEIFILSQKEEEASQTLFSKAIEETTASKRGYGTVEKVNDYQYAAEEAQIQTSSKMFQPILIDDKPEPLNLHRSLEEYNTPTRNLSVEYPPTDSEDHTSKKVDIFVVFEVDDQPSDDNVSPISHRKGEMVIEKRKEVSRDLFSEIVEVEKIKRPSAQTTPSKKSSSAKKKESAISAEIREGKMLMRQQDRFVKYIQEKQKQEKEIALKQFIEEINNKQRRKSAHTSPAKSSAPVQKKRSANDVEAGPQKEKEQRLEAALPNLIMNLKTLEYPPRESLPQKSPFKLFTNNHPVAPPVLETKPPQEAHFVYPLNKNPDKSLMLPPLTQLSLTSLTQSPQVQNNARDSTRNSHSPQPNDTADKKAPPSPIIIVDAEEEKANVRTKKKENDQRNEVIPVQDVYEISEDQMQAEMTIPIAQLSFLSENWTIKARVVHKSALKELQTKTGRLTRMFAIDLLDKDGGEIEAIFFGESCTKHFSRVREKGVYYFSGGVIKKSTLQSSPFKTDIQIIFETHSEIKEVYDDNSIPMDIFRFHTISQIQAKESGEIVDIVGIIYQSSNPNEISARNGDKVFRKNLTLYDASLQVIDITLWGQSCKVNFEKDKMIIFKNLKVGQYLGKKCLVSISRTVVITKDFPMHVKEVREIAQLLEEKSARQEVEKKNNQRHLLLDLINMQTNLRKSERHYFEVTASIIHIQSDSLSTFYYLSCPRDNCLKKVVDISVDCWKCLNCQEITRTPKPRYTLNMMISDFSGSLWVNAFDSIGESILGYPASHLKQLRESEREDDKQELMRIMKNPTSKEFNMRLMMKHEEYKGKEEWKSSILKISPLVYQDEAKKALQLLDSLELQ